MTGQATKQTPSILPVYSGATNLAPLRPLLALKDKENPQKSHYLCDGLKELYRELSGRDKDVRNEMLNVGRTMDNFLNGRQFAVPDYFQGGWRVVKAPREGATRPRATNLMGTFKTQFSSLWLRSVPDIQVDATDDDDEAIEAAKAAGAEVDHYEEKLITPWFSWQEGMAALTWGTYITRVRLDQGVDGVKALRQIFDEKTIVVPGEGDCTDCRYLGEDTEFMSSEEAIEANGGVCPQCGSPNVILKPASEQALTVPTGQEQINLGDLRLEQLPFAACWWDLAVRPEESSWFIYNQHVSLGQVREILGNVSLPEAKDEDKGLEILMALSRTGQAVSGHSRHGQKVGDLWHQQAVLSEMWLSPADYAHIKLKGDEETVSGTKLEGDDLARIAPNGLAVIGFNHMESIIGLFPSDGDSHQESLATGVYELRTHSGAGRNAADALDTQQRINKLHNQFERGADAPSYLYASDSISPANVQEIVKPNRAIPIDLTGLGGEFKRIGDAVQQLPPTAFAPQFMQYAFDLLPGILQMQMKTLQFSSALPGVDNKTATGAQIAESMANEIIRPMAQIKGAVRKQNAWQFLQLCQRHFPVERRYSYKGKMGRSQIITLSKIDLTKLRLKVVPGSELPQNDVIKRMRTNEFIQLFGGFQQYLMARAQEPMAVAALERVYDFRLDGNEQTDAASIVTGRRIKQLVALIGGGLDPMTAISELQPPIQLGERDHTVKAQRCEEWLDTDEGFNAPLPARMAVEMMARTHYDFEAQRQMLLAGAAGAVQAAGMPEQAVGAAA